MLTLTYRGNVVDTVVGRVMGPDTAGAQYVATLAVYTGYDDQTRVSFKPLPPGETRLYRDQWRELRIPLDAITEDGSLIPLDGA